MVWVQSDTSGHHNWYRVLPRQQPRSIREKGGLKTIWQDQGTTRPERAHAGCWMILERMLSY